MMKMVKIMMMLMLMIKTMMMLMLLLLLLLLILLIVKMRLFPRRVTNLFFGEVVLTPQFLAVSKYGRYVAPGAPVPK